MSYVRGSRLGVLLSAGCLAITALTGAGLTGTAASAANAVTVDASVGVQPMLRLLSKRNWQAPPTTADCEAALGLACYAPAQLQHAYGLDKLHAKGLTGAGSTIVIVDPFGSPTAAADLQQFDADFGLPEAHLRIIQPAGPVPAFDPKDATQAGWGEETSLDLQWAHTVAPGADLLLVETPVAETEGVEGFPQIVRAENYVINHRLGDVISQSFGATEQTFPTAQSLLRLRSAYQNARRHRVTVLAASGDAGATNSTESGDSFYPRRVVGWPASDPLVTAVGGTQLHLDANGNRTAPDNAWNDTALLKDPASTGGGRSSVFARPAYQNRVRSVVHNRRGVPDISMSAAVDGGVLVRIGFSGGDGITPGYYVIGGTSEATPEFAGIVAIAKQRAHHRLGFVNDNLYRLQKRPGIVDVTRGDNTVSFDQEGTGVTVKGFDAVRGYDLATGLGTVWAPALTAELAGRQR